MTPVERFLEKLSDVKRGRNGWSARCPAHDDRKPSLSVSEGENSNVIVKCHAGCSFEAIKSALGLTSRDLMPDQIRSKPKSKPRSERKSFPTANEAMAELERRLGKRSAMWTYRDAARNPVGLVVRWDGRDGKEIRPVSRQGDCWHIGAMAEPRPLYRLPELAETKLVLVTEGEKAADAAWSLGFAATTSSGGSSSAGKTDWAPLAGKEIWILPDNDEPGRKYAEEVAGLLAMLSPPPVMKVISLPGLPLKGDIVDWIKAHGEGAVPDTLNRELVTLSELIEPEVPEPSVDDIERFQPFPVEALPEPICSFVSNGAKAIGCDPSYLALPLLVSLGAAIGTTRRLELKRGWSAPAILWAVIVGESGTAKSPAFRLVMRPVRDRQQMALDRHAQQMKQYEADLAQWEKDFNCWKRSKNATISPPVKPNEPPPERFIVSDTTVEALAPILMVNTRGLLLARDELAGWIGSFDRYVGKGKAGSDASNWLSMFNAESIIVDRKTGLPRTIHVPQAAVSVTGGIQPGILQRALGTEHLDSGLAARLLLACPPQKTKKWTETDIDPATEEELIRLFDRLYGLQPDEEAGVSSPRLLALDAQAKQIWIEYYNAHAEEQSGLTGNLAAAWSKLEEYAARLALVIHFVRWAAEDPTLADPNFVDTSSIQAGIKLVAWFKREARRVYGMLSESDDERDQRRLTEWIDRKGGAVTVRNVQQGCRWLKDPGAAESALEALVKARLGSWQPIESSAKGGRPSRVFTLSKPSTVYETPATKSTPCSSVDVDAPELSESEVGIQPTGDRLFSISGGLPD